MNEFQFLDNLKSKYSLDKIGDDCAVLPKDAENDLLLTADMLIEDIDFRLKWTTPEFLGHKALAVSLSDIAAMGGTPKWAMLSLGVPESLWNTKFVDEFYAGWFDLADEFNVELVGGDISRSPSKLVVDSIVGGEVSKGKALLRSTAKPGDLIYVTNSLGAAAGGLKLLEGGFEFMGMDSPADELFLWQLQPLPQLEIGKQLSTLSLATSSIDISDGLSSDLGHICRESKVGAMIDATQIPIDENLLDFFPMEICFEMALHGGEDFELLFTVNPKNGSSLELDDFFCIGEITANSGVIKLNSNGKLTTLKPKGYLHF